MDNEKQSLLKRIAELEDEVKDREEDLRYFREQLGKTNQRLEKMIAGFRNDLKVVHQIQKAMVPTEFPNISGIEFSTKFLSSPISGGDYFDIFEHEDRFRFGTLVAASSGHTMSALFLSTLLKMSSQFEARRGSSPDKVLAKMNEELQEGIQDEDFADVFYSVVDRRSFELKYCLAGAVIALHQRAADNTIEVLEAQTPAFSKGVTPNFEVHTVSLNPRDRILIATPGVSELKSLESISLGSERFFQMVKSGPSRGVHELRNHILIELEKFSGGVERPRDMTLIIMEVKERLIKLAKN